MNPNKKQQQQIPIDSRSKKMCFCLQKLFSGSKNSNDQKESKIDTSINAKTPTMRMNKRLLILDLDQTLVHAVEANHQTKKNKNTQTIKVLIRGHERQLSLYIRNQCREFIQKMSQIFELALYTASEQDYADIVLKIIDPFELIQIRFYRDDCEQQDGALVKNLSIFNKPMKDIIIIDDLKSSFGKHPENGFPIKPFTGSTEDIELLKLVSFLEYLNNLKDVRPVGSNYKIFQKINTDVLIDNFIRLDFKENKSSGSDVAIGRAAMRTNKTIIDSLPRIASQTKTLIVNQESQSPQKTDSQSKLQYSQVSSLFDKEGDLLKQRQQSLSPVKTPIKRAKIKQATQVQKRSSKLVEHMNQTGKQLKL